MDLLSAHERAMTEFDRRVRAVPPDGWDAPTPCSDWSVRDLVNHLVSEQRWAPWLLYGATLEEVGGRFDGDVLGDDPTAAWAEAATAAREAFTKPGALSRRVHTSGGVIPAEEYGWQMTVDLAVHAWDLAKGIRGDDRIDPELAAAALDVVRPQVAQWQGLGIFDPPVNVPEHADAQTRLLGLLGRRR
ncbi:hypothetical protein GTS_02730 [Gandjariella thermophila]|uniref:Mycothiol-dependent maleylpyruvate isomerase metal-binding domain-containing protein n=2 Tax=Gandjariella thermophila TaxID=1931992 RepID=A0A4D4J0F9_9PSEU|nr:hypothetical protein GTS_02730 [Gandjariella thermophila]